MSVATQAIRNKFIVEAQANSDLTLEEAVDLADFFENIGEHMMATLTPAMRAIRANIRTKVHNELIDELIKTFGASSPVITRSSVLYILKNMKIS